MNNKIIFLIIVILLSSFVSSESVFNNVPIGYYLQDACRQGGNCTLSNLIVTNQTTLANVTVTNYNITEDMSIYGNLTFYEWLFGINADITFIDSSRVNTTSLFVDDMYESQVGGDIQTNDMLYINGGITIPDCITDASGNCYTLDNLNSSQNLSPYWLSNGSSTATGDWDLGGNKLTVGSISMTDGTGSVDISNDGLATLYDGTRIFEINQVSGTAYADDGSNTVTLADGSNAITAVGPTSLDDGAITTDGFGNIQMQSIYYVGGIYEAGVLSIDPNSRILYASDGTTAMLDWSTDGTLDAGDNAITSTDTGRFDGGLGIGADPTTDFIANFRKDQASRTSLQIVNANNLGSTALIIGDTAGAQFVFSVDNPTRKLNVRSDSGMTGGQKWESNGPLIFSVRDRTGGVTEPYILWENGATGEDYLKIDYDGNIDAFDGDFTTTSTLNTYNITSRNYNLAENYIFNFRPNNDDYTTGIRHDTYGGEALTIATKKSTTAIYLANDHDIEANLGSNNQAPSTYGLRVYNNNLLSSGSFGAGAITGTSLSAGSGAITTTGPLGAGITTISGLKVNTPIASSAPISVRSNSDDQAILIEENSGAGESWRLGVNLDGDFVMGNSGTGVVLRIDDATNDLDLQGNDLIDVNDITAAGDLTADTLNSDAYNVENNQFSYGAGALGSTSKSMLPLMMDSYADAFAFREISAIEYWDGSVWQDWSGTESGESLLDGAFDTVLTADATHSKFRITIKTAGWLLAGMMTFEREWNSAGGVGTSGSRGFDYTIEDCATVGGAYTEIATGTFDSYSSNSINSMVMLARHSGNTYWRVTIDASAIVIEAGENLKITNLKLMTSGNFARATFRGNPWTTSYDKTVTFEGNITIDSDSNGLILGDGKNMLIGYDGTDGFINPKVVGSGSLKVLGNTNITNNLTVGNDAYIGGDLTVNGNVSFENPHLYGFDNTTQSFLVLETAQVMNISNDDYHSHQISIIDNQNITFDRVGHYQICTSPQFYQASGNDKWITFWLQKNGVDVAWTNSRYTMDNDDYSAPRICWRNIITNPDTDNLRIMWLSDSTDSQIVSITGLTNPTRPSVPGVITDVTWISNGVED